MYFDLIWGQEGWYWCRQTRVYKILIMLISLVIQHILLIFCILTHTMRMQIGVVLLIRWIYNSTIVIHFIVLTIWVPNRIVITTVSPIYFINCGLLFNHVKLLWCTCGTSTPCRIIKNVIISLLLREIISSITFAKLLMVILLIIILPI